MFVPQVATQPPSSQDSPQLRPNTQQEKVLRLQPDQLPPVFTPTLHKKSQDKMVFRPRTSILDYTELMYQGNDRMRGLVTCFWTIIGAYLVSMLFGNYERNGYFVQRNLATVLFSRAKELVLSDLALVLSTSVAVPLVKMAWVQQNIRLMDPQSARSKMLQAVVELIWLGGWYWWQGSRGWPWVQRCFFALHTVVNWMKMHSYLSTNRNLASILRKHQMLKKKDGDLLEIQQLETQLCPYQIIRFPANLTIHNYVMFQLSPTLVYELEYPRTEQIRWGYVAEKLAGTLGIFCVFYVVVAHLVIPHLERMPETGILIATLHLMGPMATCWLLFFFITFDSIANGFAELTRFADRRFYDDWWNARGLDDFAKKWNRPVHMFLARHVYMPVREQYKGWVAMATTFLFSSILHEVTLVVACQRWVGGVFFGSQMLQIPLILLSQRWGWLREQQAVRNWGFWVAMVVFQPFLLCVYTYQAFN